MGKTIFITSRYHSICCRKNPLRFSDYPLHFSNYLGQKWSSSLAFTVQMQGITGKTQGMTGKMQGIIGKKQGIIA